MGKGGEGGLVGSHLGVPATGDFYGLFYLKQPKHGPFKEPARSGEHTPVVAFFCVTPQSSNSHTVLSDAWPTSRPAATHQPRSWSKTEASLNISSMVVSSPRWTLQPLSGWSNAEAPSNIPHMLVTLSTLQSPSDWLNDEASQNIPSIVVIPEVFHAPMA